MWGEAGELGLFLGFLTLFSAPLLRRQICYWMIRWYPSLGIEGSRGKSGRVLLPPSSLPSLQAKAVVKAPPSFWQVLHGDR